MVFYVFCDCGCSVCTNIIHAGSTVKCPQCKADVSVPSSNRLQDQDGNPLWTPMQLTSISLKNRSVPFSGDCQVCKNFEATKQRDTKVTFLVSKHFTSPDSLLDLPRIEIHNADLPFSASFGQMNFPLLFCDDCSKRFSHQWKLQSAKSFSEILLVVGAMVFFAMVLIVLAVVLPILTVPLAVGLIGKLAVDQKKVRPDQFVRDHIKKIKWIGDAVRSDLGMKIEVGAEKKFLG